MINELAHEVIRTVFIDNIWARIDNFVRSTARDYAMIESSLAASR